GPPHGVLHLKAGSVIWQRMPFGGESRNAMSPSPRSRGCAMGALARWSYRHRGVVVLAWVVLLVGLLGMSQVAGSRYRNDNALPGTDSQRAVNLLQRDFPAQSGEAD